MFSLKYPQSHYLQRAAQIRPQLNHGRLEPRDLVSPVRDTQAYQNVRMERKDSAAGLPNRTLNIQDTVILDFGEVAVGYFHFRGNSTAGFNNTPFRLRFVFGEFPTEIARRNEPYTGSLTRAWIQEEIVTVENMWEEIRLPRRYSMRYVAIEVLDMPCPDTLRLEDIWFETVSAVAELPEPLLQLAPQWRRIDEHCLRTLRNCMQRFYEDGPKRDRRLWGGDFRLAAKVNSVTFKRFDMTEYVLLLLAGLYREDGTIATCLSDDPRPSAPGETVDFNLMFAVTLSEYVEDTGNEELGRELYPLAVRQFELFRPNFHDGYLDADAPGWFFLDHVPELDRILSMQGLYAYCLRHLAKLAARLGYPEEAAAQSAEASRLTAEAVRRQYDKSLELFVSGREQQVSLSSQVWMVLAGAVTGDAARQLLECAGRYPKIVMPASPYGMYYYLEACESCGALDLLANAIREYWGGMLACGADTFWEVYRPGDDFYAPYFDIRLNTACHGWGAVPSYFFRHSTFFRE